MKKKVIILIGIGAFLCGTLLYLIQWDYLIIRWPQQSSLAAQPYATKKNVLIQYWNNHCWQTENQEILWSQSTPQNIQRVLHYWLRLLEDTEIISKHISIESVAFAPNGHDVYISFDRNPFTKEWSLFQKWMVIEGILKTIRSNFSKSYSVIFLLRHQPLTDPHLDFSHPWPLAGYL